MLKRKRETEEEEGPLKVLMVEKLFDAQLQSRMKWSRIMVLIVC